MTNKKDITRRIAFYTKKVAEYGSIHPSKALPIKYRFRNERLALYKKLMHQEIENGGYIK
jgi:hypothetical protein